MKKKGIGRDVVGMVLLAAGVGGVFVGIHAVSGGESSYGGPAIGAGAVANVVAYRVLRSAKRTDGEPESGGSSGAGPKA